MPFTWVTNNKKGIILKQSPSGKYRTWRRKKKKKGEQELEIRFLNGRNQRDCVPGCYNMKCDNYAFM